MPAPPVTCGGEPTIYRHFNELVLWLHARGLKVALILPPP
jgi:wyosine [tRNA(Phe)-imidazoG37] synthetase (radical SAM superfamily)